MGSIARWLTTRFETLPYGDTDLRVNCPFCTRYGGADVGHHLHVSLVKEVCHCFRCGYKATWAQLIADVDGVSIREALLALDEEAIKPLYMLIKHERHTSIGPGSSVPSWFVTINDAVASDSGALALSGNLARDYVHMRLRKYTDCQPLYRRWGINSTEYGMLVFPVEDGWWQARRMIGDGPKYISCQEPKEDRLYNWQALDNDELYVTEGIISAAAIGSQAVALCGKEATEEQLERLAYSNASKITVCLDADAMGDAVKLALDLGVCGREVWVRQYVTGDPASCHHYTDHQLDFATRVRMRLGHV